MNKQIVLVDHSWHPSPTLESVVEEMVSDPEVQKELDCILGSQGDVLDVNEGDG
jgi:hypothetical protein